MCPYVQTCDYKTQIPARLNAHVNANHVNTAHVEAHTTVKNIAQFHSPELDFKRRKPISATITELPICTRSRRSNKIE